MEKVTAISNSDAAAKRLNSRRIGYTFQEYFQGKTDGDVWVQNLSDKQISLDIEVAPGQSEGYCIPPLPDPINLAEKYGYEILKKSARFRQALAKRRDGRPELILLDSEQVESYMTSKAKMLNLYRSDGSPDVDAAMDAAEIARRKATTVEGQDDRVSPSNAHNFAPPKTAQELIAMDLSARGIFAGEGMLQSQRFQAGMPANMQGQIMMQEVVNPRILHLCQQVSPQIPPPQRMPEDQFCAAIQAMAPQLKMEDWQHVQAHGFYRRAKSFAGQKIAELAAREDESGQTVASELTLGGQGLIAKAQRQGAIESVPQGFGPQGPATLGQQGIQYQGPSGFANAPFQEAYGRAESMASPVLGPDGNPL